MFGSAVDPQTWEQYRRARDAQDPRYLRELLSIGRDAGFINAVFKALRRTGDADSAPKIVSFLDRDTRGVIRLVGIHAACTIGDGRVIPGLRTLLRKASDDAWTRAEIAKGLGQIDDDVVVPLLAGLVDDPKMKVRIYALDSLEKRGTLAAADALMRARPGVRSPTRRLRIRQAISRIAREHPESGIEP